MKQLLIVTMIIAGGLMANPAKAQVHVDAHIGVGAPATVVYERDYPGYTYYTYPAWNGHYRDREYYAHYRPRFYREHRTYFHGRRQFDNQRWERERNANRGHDDHGRRDHRH